MADPYSYQHKVGGNVSTPSYEKKGQTGRYYDDVGFRMSDEERKNYEEGRASLAEYETEARGSIDAARSSISSARSGLQTPEDMWNTFAQDFVPVHVYTGNTAEADYWFPREAIPTLMESLSQGNAHLNEDTGGINIDTEGYGKEIHEGLNDAWTAMHEDFLNEYVPQYAEASGQLASASSEVSGQEGALEAALAGADEPYEQARDQFEERRGARTATLSALYS